MLLQAIWYTEQPGTEGHVFGSNDQWKGLGVFFDSFDNDGQVSIWKFVLPYTHTLKGNKQCKICNDDYLISAQQSIRNGHVQRRYKSIRSQHVS